MVTFYRVRTRRLWHEKGLIGDSRKRHGRLPQRRVGLKQIGAQRARFACADVGFDGWYALSCELALLIRCQHIPSVFMHKKQSGKGV